MFDIVIVGGGLVGASLACALAPTNLRIAVVEAVPFKSQHQPSYDERVLAIAQGSKRILDAISVWSEIGKADATPIKTIHISDRGRFGASHLRHTKYGVEALGYTVPARALGNALIQKLDHLPHITVLCPVKVTGLDVEHDQAALTILQDSKQDKLTCRLVVFAGGTTTEIGGSLDFRTESYKYGQTAVISTVTPSFPHNNTAYERFTETGPLAMLPTRQNRYAVVWTALDEQVEGLLHCSDDDFLEQLQYRFGDRVGALQKLGIRRAYPLSFVKVERPVRSRIVVVGNAAHTIHPVAGQGFNLGLRDVSTLAEVLYDADSTGLDIGAIGVVDRYWKWRERDVNRVGVFTDSLIRTFSNNFLPLVLLRDTALVALDLMPLAQQFLVKRTMGLAGKLPRLARGMPLV
ncbi:MAG: 2-octaprenyl-6-methoxyphenyl hydroxylase [Arenicellales bacterium]|nr:2-octaprenyl-6-methoxyphenyl hydroxylase [Arenicellales bacterium]